MVQFSFFLKEFMMHHVFSVRVHYIGPVQGLLFIFIPYDEAICNLIQNVCL